jgi:hypothetical protein
MTPDFEVQLSPEYLARIEADLTASIKLLASANAFTDYNRGGGPGGSYDRHYDKSTGSISRTSIDKAST